MCRVRLLFAAPLSILVGYQTINATNKYYKLGANTFDALNGSIDIQDIVPVFPAGTALKDKDYKFTLQTFTAGAGCAKKWWYLTEDSEEECEDGTGWYLYDQYKQKASYSFKRARASCSSRSSRTSRITRKARVRASSSPPSSRSKQFRAWHRVTRIRRSPTESG